VILPTSEASVLTAPDTGESLDRESFRSPLSAPRWNARHSVTAGGIALAVDFGFLYLLTEWAGIHYLASAAIAFVFGLLTHYRLRRVWEFAMPAANFAAIGAVGLGLNETVMWFFHERIHFHYLLAKTISAGVVVIWNSGAGKALFFSPRTSRRFALNLRVLSSAYVAVACFASCLAIQYFSGAWSADFTTYSDEPAHFVGAVMVHDWLLSGQWLSPLEFARHYYHHYPYFAVGYWPPLFSLAAGAWMVLAGVGRLQALLLPAACAAGTGWLIFILVRSRAGIWAGICAGALYLSLPDVRVWMCAVMVDHMTAFFCLATGACVIRYLKDPRFSNGMWCALCCGCAILSKYSAAYLVGLPFASAVLLRRFALFRKASLLAQALVVALAVGPWALWTRKLAFYGLPSEPAGLTAKRVASYVLATFEVFPPVVMVLVISGLLLAMLRPAIWREDLAVLTLLCAGQLGFLVLSPVDAEYRKLLLPAGVVLVIAFIGWWELLARFSPGWQRTGLLFGAILTAALAVSQFRHLPQMPPNQIRQVVALVERGPARSRQHIVVPPTALEGPVIAEFVIQSQHRPDAYLLRPSKLLAHSDWFGLHDSPVFATSAEMMEYFRQNPVDLIMWSERPGIPLGMHARVMKAMLQDYPLAWHQISPAGLDKSWAIYQYNTSASQVLPR